MEEKNMTAVSEDSEDEISLIDLLAVLWHRKWMIIGIIAATMIVVVGISVISLMQPPETSILPNKYKSQATVSIISEPTLMYSLSAMMASDDFFDAVVEKFSGASGFKTPDSAEADIRAGLETSFDKSSVIMKTDDSRIARALSVSFEGLDPVVTGDIVSFCIEYTEQWLFDSEKEYNDSRTAVLEENCRAIYDEIFSLEEEIQKLNQSAAYGSEGRKAALDASMLALEVEAKKEIYKQLREETELLKLTMENEKSEFEILTAPKPGVKTGPSRGKICIIAVFASAFLAVFLAFFLNALDNMKKDPAVLEKFKKQISE